MDLKGEKTCHKITVKYEVDAQKVQRSPINFMSLRLIFGTYFTLYNTVNNKTIFHFLFHVQQFQQC